MAKKLAFETPQILERTLELLEKRPKSLTYEQIERDTGLTVGWLTALSSKGASFDPSVKRIATLYEYLSHSKLVAP